MINSIKVLSIDWDYFADCPIGFKVNNFPDGGNENLPEFVLDQIWVTKYGQCSELKDVKMDTSEMIRLRMTLKSIVNQHTTVIISDSHKDIYRYLEKFRQTNIPMELYNIDFHHDVYDFQNDNVDCGNWLRLFINSDGSHDQDTFTWVRRKDSEMSGNKTIDDNSIIGIPKDIMTPFQLVFLCRSSAWSPPHLDKEFLSLCRFLNKLNNKIVVDQKVMRNRYNRQFKYNVEHYVDIVKKIMGDSEIPNQN